MDSFLRLPLVHWVLGGPSHLKAPCHPDYRKGDKRTQIQYIQTSRKEEWVLEQVVVDNWTRVWPLQNLSIRYITHKGFNYPNVWISASLFFLFWLSNHFTKSFDHCFFRDRAESSATFKKRLRVWRILHLFVKDIYDNWVGTLPCGEPVEQHFPWESSNGNQHDKKSICRHQNEN